MAIPATTIVQTVANADRDLVFFPGGLSSADDSWLCYNYKTGQWSSVSAYAGFELFSVFGKFRDIGVIRYSGSAVDLQPQDSGDVAQTATITTTAKEPAPGGRGVVEGVRPLSNGGTHAIRVGIQDDQADSVTWVTGTSLNARSRMSNFRGNANTPEGRYIRVEDTITGGFESAIGAYIDAFPQGEV